MTLPSNPLFPSLPPFTPSKLAYTGDRPFVREREKRGLLRPRGEYQIREGEEEGLLFSPRPLITSRDGGGGGGHHYFACGEIFFGHLNEVPRKRREKEKVYHGVRQMRKIGEGGRKCTRLAAAILAHKLPGILSWTKMEEEFWVLVFLRGAGFTACGNSATRYVPPP